MKPILGKISADRNFQSAAWTAQSDSIAARIEKNNMKHRELRLLNSLLLLVVTLTTAAGQTPATNLQLRLAPSANALDLLVDGSAASGAFFIYRAFDVAALRDNPVLLVETNTPITNGMRFSLPASVDFPQAFFAAAHWPGIAVIPSGTFAMGDTFNDSLSLPQFPFKTGELPVHMVQVSGFSMSTYQVTKALWDDVYNWANGHGYNFESGAQGKAANHPAHSMTWYDAVKWCNARSEKEGRAPAYYTNLAQTGVYRSGQVDVQNGWVKWNAGYRLPTEAEWEKAARGGSSGQRFPWGNTITHNQANYSACPGCAEWPSFYDVSTTSGYHPDYATGDQPYTSPVGSFAATGYGLYDMIGNVAEWCWDWWDPEYYSSSPASDPRGPASDSFPFRMIRGGGWDRNAIFCRSAYRNNARPFYKGNGVGLRVVLATIQP